MRSREERIEAGRAALQVWLQSPEAEQVRAEMRRATRRVWGDRSQKLAAFKTWRREQATKRREQQAARLAERERRKALTPEQRQAEDRARRIAKAKALFQERYGEVWQGVQEHIQVVRKAGYYLEPERVNAFTGQPYRPYQSNVLDSILALNKALRRLDDRIRYGNRKKDRAIRPLNTKALARYIEKQTGVKVPREEE